tara:strand:+ start:48 stop:227 length:180 start_codon:yes stop_codon:yes gene_type:complete
VKKYFFLVSFILISCASNQTKEQIPVNLNFSKNMSFSEFKTKLEKYAKESSYPKLDNYE